MKCEEQDGLAKIVLTLLVTEVVIHRRNELLRTVLADTKNGGNYKIISVLGSRNLRGIVGHCSDC